MAEQDTKNKREFDEIKAQTPTKNIVCKDCEYRDKTVLEYDGKKYEVGIIKGICEMYTYPDVKPSEVLYDNAECDYYEKE